MSKTKRILLAAQRKPLKTLGAEEKPNSTLMPIKSVLSKTGGL